MSSWWKRIRDELDRKSWTIVEFERRTGIDRGRLYKYVTGEVSQPRGDAFVRMAKALEVEEWWLRSGEGVRTRRIPIIGHVHAGESWDALPDQSAGSSLFDFDPPPGDLIALQVFGASMAPAYREGDLIICNRLYVRSDLEILDPQKLHRVDCAIKVLGGPGYLKFLVPGQIKGRFTLRSYNPDYPDVLEAELEWIAPVVWVRRNRGLDSV